MPSSLFWLYTPHRRTELPVRLHRDGCGNLRIASRRKAATGPLTWDQIALLPVESYEPCRACWQCRETLHYGRKALEKKQ